MSVTEKDGQLLHFVFGGELNELQGVTFRDLEKVEMVGMYPNYEQAHRAWESQSAAICR